MRAIFRPWFFVCFVLFFARHAGADDVVPPRLERDDGVAYPATALAERFYETVVVELILEIDAAGIVTNASVVTPVGRGFDEAATSAAKTLHFAPAVRSGAPVPSRIRFRYTFAPPSPTLAGSAIDRQTLRPLTGASVTVRAADATQTVVSGDDGAWRATEPLPPGPAHVSITSDAHTAQEVDVDLVPGDETRITFRLEPLAAPENPDAPQEVVVRGEKVAPGVSSFTRGEVRNLPGAFGDPFRAIEAMPGITPTVSGLPFFYIRGAPPGNVGYYLDGVAVPTIYHVGLGPSVIHPALVDHVDLYPGGYPARYGRFAGGVVSAETAAPRTDTHGEASIRLFDAGALVETGFANGRGTVLLGGRYSYTAALVSLAAPSLVADYRDYQARITYDLGPRDRVTAFAFGSYDLLGTKKNVLGDDILSVLYGSEFYRLDLRHDHAIEGGSIRTAVTLGFDQTRILDQRNAMNRMVGARTELKRVLSRNVLLRGGADARLDAFKATEPRYFDPDDPEVASFSRLFPQRNDLAMGIWADLVLDLGRSIEVTPGIRVDHFRSGSAYEFAVDPRLAARIAVSDRVRLLHAYGLAHQPPSYVLPGAGLTPGLLVGGLQTSAQASAGVEVDVAEGTTATASGFYNAYFGMTDALGANSSGEPDQGADERARGRGVGFEFFLRRRLTNRLGGFVSYTLSRSTRTTSLGTFPSAFDRTHVGNAALSYDLGRGWRTGGRVLFYSGTPKGAVAPGGAPTPAVGDVTREPVFYRVDLRVEKRWSLGDTKWISFVAECMNVTARKETYGDQAFGPLVIPSLGVEGGL